MRIRDRYTGYKISMRTVMRRLKKNLFNIKIGCIYMRGTAASLVVANIAKLGDPDYMQGHVVVPTLKVTGELPVTKVDSMPTHCQVVL